MKLLNPHDESCHHCGEVFAFSTNPTVVEVTRGSTARGGYRREQMSE